MRYGFGLSALAAALIVAGPAWAEVRQIEVPPSRQHGLDMVVIDQEDMPEEPELAKHRQALNETWDAAAAEPTGAVSPLYAELRTQLERYRQRWGQLPQILLRADEGPIAKPDDPRIGNLRQRLGLPKSGGLDKTLQDKLSQFQQAHALAADGKAGAETLAALNRGAAYHERLILLNMERARRLPSKEIMGKYVLVDAGSARLWMYENGRVVGGMKVVVGAPTTETPMLAAMLRFSSVNPYWNVPQDLIRKLIAPKVLAQGASYLKDRGYQVLDGWAEQPPLVDPATIDWQAVSDGKLEIRVRQLPGPANSMGNIKFMMPNEYGIYLHETPNKALFDQQDRWVSNGCIRVEDAQRLAAWLYGAMPKGSAAGREERVDLAQPVPVYVTYFTAGVEGQNLAFRPDRYQRDKVLMARFKPEERRMIDPDEQFRRAMAL